MIPPSTARNPYPGRNPHWVKVNHTERIPHRWIVADCESHRVAATDGETQTLRCAVAVRWRDDLASGEQRQLERFTDAGQFWRWVREWCYTHGRTVLWFHNASVDLNWLEAFNWLPALGYDLAWCNLDRDVSTLKWYSQHGTLMIADTYTWTAAGLDKLAPLTGIRKPPLPADDDSEAAWLARCEADVLITEAIVRPLLAYIRKEHLGNWQPSGAGMGYTAWRHRFYPQKVLVHDDSDALAAERAAMHSNRAEAWWHGKAPGGPFSEIDMHMSYCRIAAECDLPAKLWEYEDHPPREWHDWALRKFRVLARVYVRTDVPCVPCRHDGRTIWPVGEFETVLWDTELALIGEHGGSYDVLEQWRYTRKPALKEWAQWTMGQCALDEPDIDLIAKTWVKHQSRAVIGRMGLRNGTWVEWADNWLPYAGLSTMTDLATGTTTRLMHVGRKVFEETDRQEAQQSTPQIPSWIMAECRARLWRATLAAGQDHVVHLDTDSLIADARGTAQLLAAAAAGLPGGWRVKDHHRALEVIGPRHYRTPTARQVPGVPRTAAETEPGVYVGETWDSLARTLTDGQLGVVRLRSRTWRPARADYRRPWGEEETGPALPIRLAPEQEDNPHANSDHTQRPE